MHIKQDTTAYDLFTHMRAEITGKTQAELQREWTPEAFEAQIRSLHARWMAGEFSFGRFTELIGIPHLELWEMLDALDLSLHR
jgi:hypothetical protein